MNYGITTLRIRKDYSSSIEMAIKWYSIISILNDFKWSPIQIKLIAFMAVKGDISSGGKKDSFCEMFSSTKQTVTNTISDLFKGGFIVKNEGKIRVHPQLLFNFEGDIVSQLNLFHVRTSS